MRHLIITGSHTNAYKQYHSPVAPPGFCNRWEVRYGSIGGLEYEVPPVPVVLSVYQRGSLLDGLALYLSCDTKKFHDNEITHIIT